MHSKKRLGCVALLGLVLVFLVRAVQGPNVLFIAIDDLSTELGCYGSRIAATPNLDALAEEGVLSQRAYRQQAICGPSRASLLAGARSDTIWINHNDGKIRVA